MKPKLVFLLALFFLISLASQAEPDLLDQKKNEIDGTVKGIVTQLHTIAVTDNCSIAPGTIREEFLNVETKHFTHYKESIDNIIASVKAELGMPVDVTGVTTCEAANVAIKDLTVKLASVKKASLALKTGFENEIAAYKKAMYVQPDSRPCLGATPVITPPHNCLKYQFSRTPVFGAPCNPAAYKAYMVFMDQQSEKGLLNTLVRQELELKTYLDSKATAITGQIAKLKPLSSCGAGHAK